MTLSTSAVRVGVWTDHSKHGALATTLTLSNRDAVALLAFLATLVGLVGVRSWRITRFILFMASTTKPVPASDLENDTALTQVLPQQVILRNSETATGAAMGLLSCGFLKAPPNQHRARAIILSALALAHGVTFIALSILTSQIVLGKTVVSKHTSTCGYWMFNNTDSPDWHRLYSEWILNSTLDADNYVQNCYFGSHGIGMFDCDTLMSQSLPFSVSHDADCPFESHVCRTDVAFAMDTQNISLAQLGINSRLADQLYFRRRSVCAPIREELFYVETLTSEDHAWFKSDDNMTVYDFDTGLNTPQNGSIRHGVRNDHLGASYGLYAYAIHMNDSEKAAARDTPLRLSDELTRGHHGPSLVLLSGNGVIFPEQSDDPLWSVHTQVKYGNGTFAGVNLDEAPVAYRMDSNLNVIGCDERFQMCARHTNRCLPWSGLFPKINATDLDGRAAEDAEIVLEIAAPLTILISLISGTSIPGSIASRDGSSALRASRNLHRGQQYYLEPEQWKTELKYWFGMSLARLQLDVYKTIEKPATLDPDGAINYWADEFLQDHLCGRVKFVSPNHTSMSFAGVLVVLIVSATLIIFSFFEVVIGLMPSSLHGSRLMQWVSSENLALLEGKRMLENQSSVERQGEPQTSTGKDKTAHEVESKNN